MHYVLAINEDILKKKIRRSYHDEFSYGICYKWYTFVP